MSFVAINFVAGWRTGILLTMLNRQ